MQSETNKFLATNRGWISTKFSVKNPVIHFLNIHKKKNNLNKTSMNNGSRFGSPQIQKDKSNNKKIVFELTKSRFIPDHEGSKQKTEPINYSMLHPIMFDTQFQHNTRTILQKRNKSLHLKKTRYVDDSMNKLKNLCPTTSKFKDERQIKTVSQRNFRVTNCGRYKPQLMFLKPQIRNGSLNAKCDKTKTYQMLEQKKTSIYKNINRSLCVEEGIDSFVDDKRSASFVHYHPIEYMTEYGEANEEQPQTFNQTFDKQHQKIVASFRRKPNIAVLKNKLNFQYKKSEYQKKISSMSIQPQFSFIDHE